MITEEIRKKRQNYIGASDVPSILGISPWTSASDLYYRKKFNAEVPESEAMHLRLGNLVEGPVVTMIGEMYGLDITTDPNACFLVHDDGKRYANLDGFTDNAVIESKLVGRRYADHWGPAESGAIPMYVAARVQTQLEISGREFAYVGALVNDYDYELRVYRVNRDEDVIDEIRDRVYRFIEDHLDVNHPPAHALPPMDYLTRLSRVAEKAVNVPILLINSYIKHQREKRDAEAALEDSKRAILAAMGDAEAGLVDGKKVAWVKTIEKKAYTVAASSHQRLFVKEPKES